MINILLGAFGVFVWLVVLYLIQLRTRDAGIADFGWATSLAFLVAWFAFTEAEPTGRAMLIALLAVGWALRLAFYILFNRVIGKEEDGRYQALRRHWGARAKVNFFFFFQAQTLVALLFSIPVLIAMTTPGDVWRIWDSLGLALWIVAVGGEWLADKQLSAFRADPDNKGKTCRNGLWYTSRHPNYFFEWLHWWAYVCFAVGHPYWAVTLTGPVLMFIFLYKISGIPYTEKQALLSRGEDYRRYQQTTSAFFPWFPRKESL